MNKITIAIVLSAGIGIFTGFYLGKMKYITTLANENIDSKETLVDYLIMLKKAYGGKPSPKEWYLEFLTRQGIIDQIHFELEALKKTKGNRDLIISGK